MFTADIGESFSWRLKTTQQEPYEIILMISHSVFVGNWLDGLKTNVSQV